MTPIFALLSVLGFLSSFASATALTYKLPPNGKECFFAFIEQKQAKVAFYFAVCAFELIHTCVVPSYNHQRIASIAHHFTDISQVQSGGSFDSKTAPRHQ